MAAYTLSMSLAPSFRAGTSRAASAFPSPRRAVSLRQYATTLQQMDEEARKRKEAQEKRMEQHRAQLDRMRAATKGQDLGRLVDYGRIPPLEPHAVVWPGVFKQFAPTEHDHITAPLEYIKRRVRNYLAMAGEIHGTRAAIKQLWDKEALDFTDLQTARDLPRSERPPWWDYVYCRAFYAFRPELDIRPSMDDLIDVYKSYHMAQVKGDKTLLQKYAVGPMLDEAKKVASPGLNATWELEEAPPFPHVYWVRCLPLQDMGNILLGQICISLETKQKVTLKIGKEVKTRSRHVKETLVFQFIEPVSKGNFWKVRERVTTIAPKEFLSAEEQVAWDKRREDLQNKMGGVE